jgi:Zn-dependent peptidase ImmA (M78 family)
MLKSVTILGRKIPIKYYTQEKMDSFIHGAIGIFDMDAQSIYLQKDLPKRLMKQTLLHEIGHVIFNMTCVDNVIPREIQEIIVQTYSVVIEDIIDGRSKVR